MTKRPVQKPEDAAGNYVDKKEFYNEMKEWKEAQEGFTAPPAEEMRLEQEDPHAVKEEWINEAVKLFGEDLVKIKDE